jgi:uncharacterized protein (DUF58 family)
LTVNALNGELLPASAAARAKQLELFARTRVEGFLRSTNRSKLKGHSTDFRQHRAYVPGDDLRNFDWRLFARSDRLVTREYDEYTNLDVIIVLDASGSMGYGSGEMTKLEFSQHCAAMLAYVAYRQHDRVALATVADKVLNFVRPSSGKKHLAEVFTVLSSVNTAGLTDITPCIAPLSARIHRKSIFVVLSDCYQDPPAFTHALGLLTLQGHDVILYQIHDFAETDLQFPGFTLFKDLESGQVDATDPMEIRSVYRDVFQDHLLRLKNGASRFGIEFHDMTVSTDWERTLARLLHERAIRL